MRSQAETSSSNRSTDLASGKYYGFSEAGSIVWEALSSGVAPAALAGGAIGAADIDEFVDRLTAFGLLAPSEETPAPLSPALAERLAVAGGQLAVDVYDDLADLVVVDPIHDVDEPVGWPAVKQA
jgi:hypothetical protein